MTDFQSFVAKNRDRMLEEVKDFLRIPSVSTDPTHNADCVRTAEWLRDHLRALGCPTVELLASKTHPVVWAEGPRVDGPTVLCYGHYDVQPPDPLELWDSPPFEPTVRHGDLFARGATDDKGQTFAIIKAFEALMSAGTPPVNVHFVIEGQEESGSGVLFGLLEREPERTEADAVLVADMPYYAPGWPAVETALRGMVYAELTVRTAKGDLHSGMYGGAAPNAHETLVRILAGLKGENGRIRIPGLYDDVVKPSKRERDAWAKLPFSERKFMREEVGSTALTGIQRASVFERIWALPTFEIHGIMGGFTSEGAKTVIPAEAKAKISLRLVPNQKEKKVQRQLTRAIKALAPKYAKIDIRFLHGADPVQVSPDSAPIGVMDQAFREVEGRGVVPIRSGGSIPIVPALAQRGAPVVLAGVGLPDDRLHAPNEKINVEQMWKGVRVFARFFELMGGR